jgi:N-acetylneuraminic acid mutarotase
MIIWGGRGDSSRNDGGIYDSSTDSWTWMSNQIEQSRWGHSAVWTGSKMIIWGGELSGQGTSNNGGIYDLTSDSWSTLSSTSGLSSRRGHTAVWTGSKMIIWGGASANTSFNNGASYNPTTDTWESISNVNAPCARVFHAAAWTGEKMVVFGGLENLNTIVHLNSGGVYDPNTDTWSSLSDYDAPSARAYHSAVWSGEKIYVFGGESVSGILNDLIVFVPKNP